MNVHLKLATAVVVAGTVASVLTGTQAARADGSESSSPFVLPNTQAIAVAQLSNDVALPGGGALRFPVDAVIVRTATESEITFADGLDVVIPSGSTTRTPTGYYDPIITTYSRSQTETVYKAVNNIGSVCKFLPLSYLAGIGCGASPTVSNAFTQAHYQSKRVREYFYRSKACSSCSKTEYKVIA